MKEEEDEASFTVDFSWDKAWQLRCNPPLLMETENA